ncbi:PREDICTED: NADH dehydrogenase [ubiquinone] 1 alpha subcomplex assembly factor 3-like [Amphimedon queenslandica]|uniref:NADH dehydrogenase [ubiquinone] 1 alpha subcomplex assembly factor 3 n=1 Tax=Amphimedon queenslandica TaxID=400682 RepID=A0A1X7VLK1_AMPQE|nr:PREDICTED: NADH dehydrogenase [ubiquinone] 1 alpha subcomplex assembly factor 3-like [Amphimedon queenslandica]|eukprot:XP_003383876.3 PREDICTED: NADH dehydrogenase [ubiquinone] 1 alpha subcomplex assembly factor 3-like [Amphimedon queenslandica]
MASKWRLLNSHHFMKSPLLYRIRHHSDGGGMVLQTTLSRVSVEEAAPLISGYSVQGFNLRGVQVMGSVALLPRGFFHWKINSADAITPESMSIFTLIEPKLELVILGTGSRMVNIDTAVKRYLQGRGISVEIQDTANACATFNFLLDDGRLAGAALIPPETVSFIQRR